MATTSDTAPTCVVVRPGETYDDKQGFTYVAGISAESAGSTGICMHLLTIPPGRRAKAHLHEHHETAIYVVSGESETWYGEGLTEHAVIARTDPNEQESVVLRPDLEPAVAR